MSWYRRASFWNSPRPRPSSGYTVRASALIRTSCRRPRSGCLCTPIVLYSGSSDASSDASERAVMPCALAACRCQCLWRSLVRDDPNADSLLAWCFGSLASWRGASAPSPPCVVLRLPRLPARCFGSFAVFAGRGLLHFLYVADAVFGSPVVSIQSYCTAVCCTVLYGKRFTLQHRNCKSAWETTRRNSTAPYSTVSETLRAVGSCPAYCIRLSVALIPRLYADDRDSEHGVRTKKGSWGIGAREEEASSTEPCS